MHKFKELDIVVLQKDLPAHHLRAGDLGTIVQVHPQGLLYEVEFLRSDGRTIAVLTLPAESLSLPGGAEVLHARPLFTTS
jgi:hypothetical protein